MITLSGAQVCSTVVASCGKRWHLSTSDSLRLRYHSLHLQQLALPLSTFFFCKIFLSSYYMPGTLPDVNTWDTTVLNLHLLPSYQYWEGVQHLFFPTLMSPEWKYLRKGDFQCGKCIVTSHMGVIPSFSITTLSLKKKNGSEVIMLSKSFEPHSIS